MEREDEDDYSSDDEERLAELVELYMERTAAGEALSPVSFAAAYPYEEEELLGLLSTLESVQHLSHHPQSFDKEHAYPDVLGGYRLIEKIGRGGMGTVFRALQLSLQREVAIKILAPSWNDDEHHRSAFENESKLIAHLRHTNIVEVYGAGQEGGYRYYVMELVDGESLSPKVVRKSYPAVFYPKAIAALGVQAASALAFAHQNGVLHRDVKPGNLLLDKKGNIHVSDFGLATILNIGEAAPMVTMSNDGTLRYMAPERLMKGESSYKVDQYALGLSLYELLIGKPAFAQSEPGQLVKRICDRPIRALQGYGELGAIINKSISFHAEDRYEHMQEMAEDLQRYLDGVPVVASRATYWHRYCMWVKRRRAVALWSHLSAIFLLSLLGISVQANISISQTLKNENEQRLLAERNAEVADTSMKRIFDSMGSLPTQQQGDESYTTLPSSTDVRLMQDLLPYYAEVALQGKNSSADIASANYVLASIALRTGDYATAELYFEEAIRSLSPDSADYVECLRGLCNAVFLQSNSRVKKKAAERLKNCISKHLSSDDEMMRLALIKCIRLLLNYAALPREKANNRGLLVQAAHLFKAMRDDDQSPITRRLMQADLLLDYPQAKNTANFVELGKGPQQLVDEALAIEPDNLSAQRSYLKILVKQRTLKLSKAKGAGDQREPGKVHEQRDLGKAPEHKDAEKHKEPRSLSEEEIKRQLADLERAIVYAQNILAEQPGDLESVFLYLTIRGRYSECLRLNERAADAKLENERTLGVLGFLTSQAEFSPEMGEQLVMMVASRPGKKSATDQREKELMVLMRQFDETKAKSIRERIEMARRNHHSHDKRKPPPKQGRSGYPQM